jgi:arylsulfatase A-like enzyme
MFERFMIMGRLFVVTLFLLAPITALSGACGSGGSGGEVGERGGYRYLDHPEELDAEVVDKKIGDTVEKAIEITPDNNPITLALPSIGPGSSFRCALGMESPPEISPLALFTISLVSESGVRTELQWVRLDSGAIGQWRSVRIDLPEAGGGQRSLEVSAETGAEDVHTWLANPMIAVGSSNPRRMVLVCIDTLRADRLGCCGCDRGLTSSIDSLARESVLFTECESAAPWTLPSCAATHTGRYPGMIAANRATHHLRPEEITLAELFHDAGFGTGSVVANINLMKDTGFFQGFEYQLERSRATADQVVDSGIEWMNQNSDRDFFLYLHLNDPHSPYSPPEPFLSRFRRGSGRFDAEFDPNLYHGAIADDFTDDEKEQIRGLYDGEVAFADAELGRLIEYLKSQGWWKDIVLIVWSDHGEEFWETDHGGYGHGHTMYEELTHVPLIMKFPGLEPEIRDDRVGLVDIVPALISREGLATPDGLAGMDILSESYDRRGSRQFIIESVKTGPEQKAIVLGNWKQIMHFGGDEGPELYDLDVDPGERENLIGTEPALAEPLISLLMMYTTQTSEGFHLMLYPTDLTGTATFSVVVSVSDGEFKDVTYDAVNGEVLSESEEDRSLSYEVSLNNSGGISSGYFMLDFLTEPEDVDVGFEVRVSGRETELPWHFGNQREAVMGNEVAISMVDSRISMSFPEALGGERQGVYIWSVPPSVRIELEDTLSQETLEELRALGYVQ